MLNNVDLFKVRLISELVQCESLIGAAKQLKITSSAVSQNIRNLERSLGRPLFMRIGKGIKPTPLAIEIAKLTQPFFSNLALILEDSHEKVAELRIAAPPIFGSTALLTRLEKVKRKYSSVRISVTLLDTQRIIDDLLSGKVDFGFIDDGPHIKSQRQLVTTPFLTEELVLCCSTEFRRAYIPNTSIKILKSLPHIPYHQGKEGIAKWYLHHYKYVPDFPYTIAIDNPYGVLNAVRRGWGLGVVPQGLITNYEGQISVISGPKSELRSEIRLSQCKERIPSKLEKSVVSLLLQK